MATLPATISRYKILKRLGEGGMGSLYLARDPDIDRLVAIKLLREDVESDELRERFRREARSVGRLRHQNIVIVFDVGEDEGRPFIAMEYIEGQTLSGIIREKQPVAMDRKLQWIEQLCDGLAYAHRANIVHRDIKPANLMVDNDQTLKILDFGIARFGHAAATGMTQSGTLMGTLNYMSPEQMTGRPVDHRSDIFAVGAVAYELLAYQRAFAGDIQDGILHRIIHEPPPPLNSVAPGVDRVVADVISKALEKDRDKRYQTLDDMRTEIQRFRLLKSSPETPASERSPSTSTFITMGPGSLSRVRGADPAAAARMRAERIELLLEQARSALESQALEQVFDACQQVLVLDPENVVAQRLSDRAQATLEELQLRTVLTDARSALGRDDLDRAFQLVGQALAINPTSAEALQLRKDVDEARKRAEAGEQRVRAIRDAIERAEFAFSERAYESALRFAEEALEIEPRDQHALDLRQQAAAAIEAQRSQRRTGRARAAEGERRRAGARDPERQRVAAEPERGRREPEAQRARDGGERRTDAQPPAAPVAAHLPVDDHTVVALPPPSPPPVLRPASLDKTLLVPLPNEPVSTEVMQPIERTIVVAPPSGSPVSASAPPPSVDASVVRPQPVIAAERWFKSKGALASLAATGLIVALLGVGGALRVGKVAEFANPVMSGTLALDIAPWANVNITAKSDGQRIQGCTATPCVLSLPAGRYNISATNPILGDSLGFDITINPGQSYSETRPMPHFSAQDEINRILK